MTKPTSCPDWCTVDHASDGFGRHGHVVHQAVVDSLPSSDESRRGADVSVWHSTQHAWKPVNEAVEIHVKGQLICRFDDPDALRRHADEYWTRLMSAADFLESLSGVRA